LDNDARVKYLFLNFRYQTYLRLQAAIVTALLVAAVLFFLFTRGHSFWLLDNAWWACLVVAGLEVAETWLALRQSKRWNETPGTTHGDES
jgi:uncharacterized membrane protein